MSNTATLTAEILRQLADVAEGKKEFDDVVKSVTNSDSEIAKIKHEFDSFKSIISSLKNNIKESVKDEIRTNDLNAKYETSSAMEVKDSEGNTVGYVGLKTKQKKSWWEKVKESMATSFQNRADLLTGKKTLKQVMREDASRLKENLMETSVVFRKPISVADGVHKGFRKTISELRGIEQQQARASLKARNDMLKAKMNASNKYAALDDGQFAVALGSAYDNFARLEHLNAPDSVKNEVLGEIGLVLEEAKKRFPNAAPEPTKGSYYKDQNVADMEQKLMPYMREASKTNPILRDDVKRYESWRNGQDATVLDTPALKLSEMPFENFARYASPDDKTSFTAEINHFRNPYESGSNAMSAQQLAQQKALADSMNIR
ncbi:MAG: hypothetical protein J5895_02755 [Alphaproteobacteria bacterium]|nr:hypothetical protein [Alphaproteobacteria bacterium]